MPVSRKTRKSSKSMKKSLNNKKVNCKDLIKTPKFKMTKQMVCFPYHKKEKTQCNNDITKLIVNQCEEKNKHSNNTSTKKELNCKDKFNTPFVNQMKDIVCKKFSKTDKKYCENAFKKSFLNTCNEKQKIMKSMKSMKSMKGGKCCKCKGGRGAWGTSCYDNPKNCCKKIKTAKKSKTNKSNTISNTKKTKKSFMSKLVFWK